ncbi:competence type IV pilus minor pilin ComGF [Virgibacillus ndiopensis]|uniref:competence type IV pilus minor pilin ComGF n=1 Tax=Virgibacillus ndiopensis TaxID=2004408 RepID=UPI00159BC23B|nr:ComGF family competence protein [Virgibacillus ndiopensis]
MDINKNEQGFTFITLLVTITIFFMTLPFVGYIPKTITYSSNYDEISVLQFFNFLRDDVIKATDFTIDSNRINLNMKDGTVVSFEQYGDIIRRQVDGQGHEIYLHDIKNFELKPLPYGIHLTITSIQGDNYEKSIIFYR